MVSHGRRAASRYFRLIAWREFNLISGNVRPLGACAPFFAVTWTPRRRFCAQRQFSKELVLLALPLFLRYLKQGFARLLAVAREYHRLAREFDVHSHLFRRIGHESESPTPCPAPDSPCDG